MKKGVIFLGIFFIVVLMFISVNVYIKSRQEYSNKYDFVVTKIRSNAKGYLTFYDSLRCEYSFVSYKFTERDSFRVLTGDKIFKKSYSKNMTISRKIDGDYRVYHVREPNGMFPFSFYGDDSLKVSK